MSSAFQSAVTPFKHWMSAILVEYTVPMVLIIRFRDCNTSVYFKILLDPVTNLIVDRSGRD